jgi:hypothetical protein
MNKKIIQDLKEKKKCRIFIKKKRGAFTSVDNLDGCENRRFYI